MGNDFKFLKGNIETIILNALYNGDKYGYEIAKEIKEKTENKYEIKQPTLYGYLKRLEEQDLVECYWGEESHGGRRKYFRLTSHGKATCEQYLSEWNFHRNILDSLISEPAEDLPEYTPQDNVFLGSKGSRKRKQRKDFRDEAENQQLFAELMKLSQSAEESDEVEEQTDDVVLTEEDFDVAQQTFEDEQIFDETAIVETQQAEVLQNDDVYTAEITQKKQVFEPVEEQPAEDNSDPLYNLIETDDKVEESCDTEEIKIATCPVIERKAGEVAETEITNEFTFVEIEQKEELPRIDNCDEKFVPKTEYTEDYSYVSSSKEEKSEFLTSIFTKNEEETVATPSASSQQNVDENETEAQYRQILNSLLGDQIVNTDEKIAQISPQISSYRDEFTSENLTMAEMADSLAKEGYRIRFYNTTTSQYKAVPMLIKNKINCVTAWSTLIAFYALLGLSWLICGSGVSIFGVCATAFLFLLIPAYYTYVYISKPNIRVKPTHDFKHSIISKLIIFVFATALIATINLLLLKTNLANPADIMHKFIIPELLILMLVVSEMIYNTFSKHKAFYN